MVTTQLRFTAGESPASAFITKVVFIYMKILTVVSILLTVGLGGCAQLQSVKPGTPVADVIKQFGQPNTVCRQEDGTERLVWTQQPMGHYAWGTDTTKDQKVIEIKQLLTDTHFEVLAQGTWSDKQVLCEFGPPANIEGVAKGNEKVWAYRYMQFSTWYSLMYVYMGADGKQANRFHPGPDPWRTGNR